MSKVKAAKQVTSEKNFPDGEVVGIDELRASPSNPRRHGDRNLSAAAESLRAFGGARSIVIDGAGIVRAGNATLEAARAVGMTRARVIEADGNELIVVRRRDWNDDQAEAYEVADNRVAELAEWDPAALVDKLANLPETLSAASGFSAEESEALAARLRDADYDERMKQMARNGGQETEEGAGPDPNGSDGMRPLPAYPDLKTVTLMLDESEFAAFQAAVRTAKARGAATTPAAVKLICEAYLHGS